MNGGAVGNGQGAPIPCVGTALWVDPGKVEKGGGDVARPLGLVGRVGALASEAPWT